MRSCANWLSNVCTTFVHHTQARSRDFTLGGYKSCEGAPFFLKKVDDLFSLFLSSPSKLELSQQRGPYIWDFEISETHRTQQFWLLIERTVLLYWIKQALRPNKASFFRNRSTQSTFGGRALGAWPLPLPLATPLSTYDTETQTDRQTDRQTPVKY